MAIDVARLVANSLQLVCLPETTLRINQLIDQPEASVRDLSRLIETDPGLAAQIMRVANSPFFGYSGRVDTLQRAVALLGFQELRNIILALTAVSSLRRLDSNPAALRSYWYHSLSCAVVARLLAEKSGVLHKERLFTLGLLHDLGEMILRQADAAAEESVRIEMLSSGRSRHEVELSLLGTHHGEITALILEGWRLPNSLTEAIRRHHEPDLHAEFALETALLHVADRITDYIEKERRPETELRIATPIWETIGLSESIIEPILIEIGPRFKEIQPLFMPAGSALR